jgi:hypothetical protein
MENEKRPPGCLGGLLFICVRRADQYAGGLHLACDLAYLPGTDVAARMFEPPTLLHELLNEVLHGRASCPCRICLSTSNDGVHHLPTKSYEV